MKNLQITHNNSRSGVLAAGTSRLIRLVGSLSTGWVPGASAIAVWSDYTGETVDPRDALIGILTSHASDKADQDGVTVKVTQWPTEGGAKTIPLADAITAIQAVRLDGDTLPVMDGRSRTLALLLGEAAGIVMPAPMIHECVDEIEALDAEYRSTTIHRTGMSPSDADLCRSAVGILQSAPTAGYTEIRRKLSLASNGAAQNVHARASLVVRGIVFEDAMRVKYNDCKKLLKVPTDDLVDAVQTVLDGYDAKNPDAKPISPEALGRIRANGCNAVIGRVLDAILHGDADWLASVARLGTEDAVNRLKTEA